MNTVVDAMMGIVVETFAVAVDTFAAVVGHTVAAFDAAVDETVEVVSVVDDKLNCRRTYSGSTFSEKIERIEHESIEHFESVVAEVAAETAFELLFGLLWPKSSKDRLQCFRLISIPWNLV